MPMLPCLNCSGLTRSSRCPTCLTASLYQTANRRHMARAVTATARRCEHCDGSNRLTAHHRIPGLKVALTRRGPRSPLQLYLNRVEVERKRAG